MLRWVKGAKVLCEQNTKLAANKTVKNAFWNEVHKKKDEMKMTMIRPLRLCFLCVFV